MKPAIVLAATLTPFLHPEVPPPPVEFDHPPRGGIIVQHYRSGQVADACRLFPGASHLQDPIDACARMIGSICQLVLPWPGDIGAEKYAALVRHEMAHCNGWRHDDVTVPQRPRPRPNR